MIVLKYFYVPLLIFMNIQFDSVLYTLVVLTISVYHYFMCVPIPFFRGLLCAIKVKFNNDPLSPTRVLKKRKKKPQ